MFLLSTDYSFMYIDDNGFKKVMFANSVQADLKLLEVSLCIICNFFFCLRYSRNPQNENKLHHAQKNLLHHD